ncbi:MAG: hypothetical protein ACYDHT_10930, partial [Solirubrobacteraceae bacterium]
TFSAPAALARRKRPLNMPRRLLLAAAAGELAADKLPTMPSRLQPRGLRGRLLSSAICGRLADGPRGAATGVVAALLSAVVGHTLRGRRPGWSAAICEDFLAIALASAGAARSGRATQATP